MGIVEWVQIGRRPLPADSGGTKDGDDLEMLHGRYVGAVMPKHINLSPIIKPVATKDVKPRLDNSNSWQRQKEAGKVLNNSAILAKHSNIYSNVSNNPSGWKTGHIYTGPHLPPQSLHLLLTDSTVLGGVHSDTEREREWWAPTLSTLAHFSLCTRPSDEACLTFEEAPGLPTCQKKQTFSSAFTVVNIVYTTLVPWCRGVRMSYNGYGVTILPSNGNTWVCVGNCNVIHTEEAYLSAYFMFCFSCFASITSRPNLFGFVAQDWESITWNTFC